MDYEYNIGKFEVTAGQYTEFLNAVAATDIYGLYNTDMDVAVHSYGCNIQRSGSSGSYTYSVGAEWADRPVNFVNWGDSVRFANWLTNGMPTGAQDLTTTEDGSYLLNGAMNDNELMAVVRRTVAEGARYVIPTEDEWYKAAYHRNDSASGNYFDYPTSSDIAPGYIVDGGSIGDPDLGNFANYDGDEGIDGIGAPYFRTEVGEFETSPSPYGVFDMGGNVWEWNEAVIGSYRNQRGGSFGGFDINLHTSFRGGDFPSYDHPIGCTGFRIAEVPEPATMSLLLLGGLSLLRKRGK